MDFVGVNEDSCNDAVPEFYGGKGEGNSYVRK
jgi:hypothetical protein